MRRLRILHAVRQYLPGIGGIENFVTLLAAEQRRAGHDVRIVTLDRIFDGDGRRLPVDETIDGVGVQRVAFTGSRRYPFAPGALRHVGDTDVVHVHGVEFFAEAFAIASLWNRAALVLSTHGGIFHTGTMARAKRLWFATATRLTLTRYDRVIASSLPDAATFSAIAGDKVIAIENGVDISKFAGLATPATRTMIYFGRLAPNKCVHRLLAWFAGLCARDPGWQLIVAGKPMGVDLAELRYAAHELGVERAVAFHAAPSDAELRTLIARSSVYACASAYEGFGLAAVEAASAGLFPLLSDIPAFRRTLARLGTGLAIGFEPDADHDAFLHAFAAFEADPGRAARLADRLATFGWGGVAAAIEDVYRAALTGRGRGAPPVGAQQQRLAAMP